MLDFGLAKAFAGDAASALVGGPVAVPDARAHGRRRRRHPRHRRLHVARAGPRPGGRQARRHLGLRRACCSRCSTGTRPFGGETVSEILAAVIKDEPTWARPAGRRCPPAVAGVLRRCLGEGPGAGGSTTSATRASLLEDASREPEAPRAAGPRPTLARSAGLAPGGRRHRRRGALAWKRSASPPAEPLTQLRGHAPERPADGVHRHADPGAVAGRPEARVHGERLHGTDVIHLRGFDQHEARPIPGTEGGSSPFFSPDGASLGFFADRRLKTISARRRARSTRGERHQRPRWPGDPMASILFSPEYDTGLWRVPAAGGVAQPVVSPETDKGERTLSLARSPPRRPRRPLHRRLPRQPERLRQGPNRGVLLRDSGAPRRGGRRQHGPLRASRHPRLLARGSALRRSLRPRSAGSHRPAGSRPRGRSGRPGQRCHALRGGDRRHARGRPRRRLQSRTGC